MSTPEAPPASARVAWGPLAVFLVIALGGAWLVSLPLWLGDGLADPIAGLLIPALMYTPALAAVVAVRYSRTVPSMPRAGSCSSSRCPARPSRRPC